MVTKEKGSPMKKYIIPIIIGVFVFDAYGAVKVKNSTAERYEQQVVSAKGEESIGADEAIDIATLENDIRILDEEIEKCKKQKKGWIAATVIGAAGIVATGTAAAVQGAKLSEKKGEYENKKQVLDDKNRELDSLKQQTKTK